MTNIHDHTDTVAPLSITYRHKGNWFMSHFYEYMYMTPEGFYRLAPLLTDAEQERQNFEKINKQLEKEKTALPDFDLNQIYALSLKQYLRDKMKLGCSMAYIYAYYSQNPNNDELLSYSLEDFQARLIENEFFLFPDKSSCHISDVLTKADHLKIAKDRRVKTFKKVSQRVIGFTQSFLKKVIDHAL